MQVFVQDIPDFSTFLSFSSRNLPIRGTYNEETIPPGKHGGVARMPHTPTVREGILLGLFVVLQFFWLFAAFAYSDGRSQERTPRDETRESANADPGPTPQALPSVVLPVAAPDAPNAPSIQFPSLGSPT